MYKLGEVVERFLNTGNQKLQKYIFKHIKIKTIVLQMLE